MLESAFNKVASLYQKEIPTQVFFCKYCKIFKSTHFEEHLRTAASTHSEHKQPLNGYEIQKHIYDSFFWSFFPKIVNTKSCYYFSCYYMFHDRCLGRCLCASGIQKTDSCKDANLIMLKINLFMYNAEK